MPTYWLLPQATTSSSTAPVVWISSTGTGTNIATPIWTTTATDSTANTVWLPMAHSAFDTNDHYYYDQLALQRRLLDTRPGSIVQLNNNYQQLGHLGQVDDPQIARQLVEAQLQRQEVELRYMREMQEREQQHARNRESARNRARDLLMDHLTEAQRDTMHRLGWFVVEGGVSKRQYRIYTGRGPAGNIEELDSRMLMGDRPVARLCAHVRHVALPDYDEFLAQMIMLQADEDAFLRIANRSALR